MLTWCAAGGEEIELEARVAAALDGWGALAACAELSNEGRGACDTAGDVDLAVLWADPDDELPEGVLVATFYALDGAIVTGAWLVINDGVVFSTDEGVAGGNCMEEWNLDLLLRHEIGHFLGLGHTCDEAEACTDAEARAAVMYWSDAPCEVRTWNEADAALLRAEHADTCGEDTGRDDTAGDSGDPDTAVWPDGVSSVNEDEPADAGCGCATGGPQAVGLLGIVLPGLLGRRRRG